MSYSTAISQRFLPKVYEMFEKVRDCEQQLNPRATRRRTHLTLWDYFAFQQDKAPVYLNTLKCMYPI